MKILCRIAVFITFQACFVFSNAQSKRIDSLKAVSIAPANDSIRMETLAELGMEFISFSKDSAIRYFEITAELARKLLAKNLPETRKKFLLIHYADACANAGYLYNRIGIKSKALELFHQTLKINEEVQHETEYAVTLINIGLIYYDYSNYTLALDYYNKALVILQKLNEKEFVANAYNNIASVYYRKKEFDKAIYNFNKSIEIRKSIKDKNGLGEAINNLGFIYLSNRQLDSADKHFKQALDISKEIGDHDLYALALNNISKIHIEKKNYQKAITLSEQALQLSQDLRSPEKIKNSAENLVTCYKLTGNYRKAFEMLSLYELMNDSLFRVQDRNQSIQKQYQFEYAKKANRDSLLALEEKKEANAKIVQADLKLKQEKIIRFSLFGGLALVAVFAFLIFNRYKTTAKQKKIIELKEQETQKQKHEIEEKNKEITDSINYAKRLQEAILPTPELIRHHLPESFILYKPKDIVAGDFYWMDASGNTILIAAADSTGHGVPGALVSVVCSNALHRAVNEFGESIPGDILSRTRELIEETFEKSSTEVKDGMDISLMSIDLKSRKILWGGANNPLWMINKGELVEIKGNKQPVGKTENPMPFTTHEVRYEKGTVFYLVTDGFADQFGGPKGKKLKSKILQDKLISVANEDVEIQKTVLTNFFLDWQGTQEQVDDVTVIGIRV